MLLPQLRSTTADLHERIERAVRLPDRLQSRESYGGLLARYYGFYKPLEDRLAITIGYVDVGIDLAQRLKAPLLYDDLLALGHSEAAIDSVPVCDSLPSLSSLDDAFGCLYVLEGATLGGKIVRKEIERVHGLVAGRGGAFFSCYGEDVGPMWRSFCAALEEHAQRHPDSEDIVIDAAVATFTAFEHWLLG